MIGHYGRWVLNGYFYFPQLTHFSSSPGLLDHIIIRLGPTPPMLLSFTVWSSLLAHAWELFLVGNQCDNTHSLKPFGSFGMWKNSIKSLGNNESDVNLNICNIDRVLSHWFPTRRSTHASASRKTGQWRRRGRGGAQPNEDVSSALCLATSNQGCSHLPQFFGAYTSILFTIKSEDSPAHYMTTRCPSWDTPPSMGPNYIDYSASNGYYILSM